MKQPWQYKAAYWSLIGALLGYGFMNQSPALADSNPIGFYSDSRTKDDLDAANYLKVHSHMYTNSSLSIHDKETSIQTSVKYIDGPDNAIEISQERTSLPSEYVAIPVKSTGERYAGN